MREALGVPGRAATLLKQTYNRPCSANTIRAKVRNDPYLQKVCAEAKAHMTECVRYIVYKRAVEDNFWPAQQLILTTHDKENFGRQPAVEINQVAGGGPLNILNLMQFSEQDRAAA